MASRARSRRRFRSSTCRLTVQRYAVRAVCSARLAWCSTRANSPALLDEPRQALACPKLARLIPTDDADASVAGFHGPPSLRATRNSRRQSLHRIPMTAIYRRSRRSTARARHRRRPSPRRRRGLPDTHAGRVPRDDLPTHRLIGASKVQEFSALSDLRRAFVTQRAPATGVGRLPCTRVGVGHSGRHHRPDSSRPDCEQTFYC